jgi:signal transduction protein with GAF and PtsI domain
MKSPIEREGLTIFEIAFLRKCNADLVVPLLTKNKVVGVLMLQSGRAGSLAEYRSGELLAFDLIGMKIAEILSMKTIEQADSSLYLVTQL